MRPIINDGVVDSKSISISLDLHDFLNRRGLIGGANRDALIVQGGLNGHVVGCISCGALGRDPEPRSTIHKKFCRTHVLFDEVVFIHIEEVIPAFRFETDNTRTYLGQYGQFIAFGIADTHRLEAIEVCLFYHIMNTSLSFYPGRDVESGRLENVFLDRALSCRCLDSIYIFLWKVCRKLNVDIDI